MYLIRPLFRWKPPVVFCNRITCEQPPRFRKPCWSGPFLLLQLISYCLLSVHVAPKAQISIRCCEDMHTIFLSGWFALAVPSAQTILSIFLHDWPLIMYVSIHLDTCMYPNMDNRNEFGYWEVISMKLKMCF